MLNLQSYPWVLLLLCFALFSCDDEMQDTDPVINNCNAETTPIVFVHGFLASGDTWKNQQMRFSSNNYCLDRIYAFDWNSLSMDDHTAGLDAFIDEVLQATGASRVNLAGHSAGGGVCYDYLSDDIRAQKVNAYVHIGSSPQGMPAGPEAEIPTMNIWSEDDEVVSGAEIPGARNVQLTGFDHYEVATNAVTFDSMYIFFNDGEAAQTNMIFPEENVSISGKALAFGENIPVISGEVAVYRVDPATGFRQTEQPQEVFTTEDDGSWGPFNAEPGAYYEFRILKDETSRPIHYYMEPFVHSSSMIYLRVLPSSTSLAGLILSQLPSDDNQTVLAVFTSNQAVINGRDELFVEGEELSTAALASPESSSIAYFLYDDGDGVSSGDPNPLYSAFPFLNGVDLYFQASEPETLLATFNGRSLNVRNWPSASEGPVVLVFN